jgi:hypothetical protein
MKLKTAVWDDRTTTVPQSSPKADATEGLRKEKNELLLQEQVETNAALLSWNSVPQIICTKCKQSRDETDFHRNKNKKNGRESHCRECISTGKATAYQAKVRRQRELEQRRKRTNVLEVNQFEVVEIYQPFEKDSIESIIMDFIEAVLCQKIQNSDPKK